jgi:hypothetical protein
MSKRRRALLVAVCTFFSVSDAQAAIDCIAPPVLVTPLSYVDKCPGDSGFPPDVRAGGKDVYIKLPTTRPCSASLTVTGAKNARITGGHFVQGDAALATITIRNLTTATTEPTGTIFIDGLNIDVNGKTADAIRTYNYKGNLILQNANVRGSNGDVIHAQTGGPLASLTMQNVTAITGSQGLFTPYRLSTGHGTRRLTLDRVQFAYDPKYSKSPLRLLYIGNADSSKERVPDLGSTFSSVYLDGLFWQLPYYKTSYAEPAPSTTCSTYAAKHKVTGSVCQGPPASEFAPAAQVGLSYSRSAFCTASPITFTVQKRWFASATTADYSFYSPPNSEFVTSQNPWGHWDMAAGDVYMAEASTGSNGSLRLRSVSGPLRSGANLPKGAPNITFGDHFHLRPAVRPLGDGVWSNAISELKVSVGGSATPGSTGAYARAIQIHGFRTAYTGSAWTDVSKTDGDTYDIQIRYKTSGAFPRFTPGGVPSDVFRERKQIGPHTWDIYRTNGGWASDLGMSFVLDQDVDSISNADIKAILDYTLADANARYGRNDTGIYVRGVQAWIETLSGTVDATIEGMTVSYNGRGYGMPASN